MADDKQTTESAPWKPAQAGLKNVIGQAGDLYGSGQSFLAPQSGYTTQANQMVADMAGRPIGPSDAFNQALDFQAGKMTDDISRGFGLMGRGGSVAHQNALAEQVGGMRNALTAQEIARQEGLQGQNVGLLSQIGAQQDARSQMDSPWGRLGQYAGLMGGLGGMGGTQTQTQSGGLGVFGDVAGLGLSALGMASGMPALGMAGGLFGGGRAGAAPMPVGGMYGGMSPFYGTGGLY